MAVPAERRHCPAHHWEGQSRRTFVTQDGSSLGPGSWPSSAAFPSNKGNHPVAQISFVEAQAFTHSCKLLDTRRRGTSYSLMGNAPNFQIHHFLRRGSPMVNSPFSVHSPFSLMRSTVAVLKAPSAKPQEIEFPPSGSLTSVSSHRPSRHTGVYLSFVQEIDNCQIDFAEQTVSS